MNTDAYTKGPRIEAFKRVLEEKQFKPDLVALDPNTGYFRLYYKFVGRVVVNFVEWSEVIEESNINCELIDVYETITPGTWVFVLKERDPWMKNS